MIDSYNYFNLRGTIDDLYVHSYKIISLLRGCSLNDEEIINAEKYYK